MVTGEKCSYVGIWERHLVFKGKDRKLSRSFRERYQRKLAKGRDGGALLGQGSKTKSWETTELV